MKRITKSAIVRLLAEHSVPDTMIAQLLALPLSRVRSTLVRAGLMPRRGRGWHGDHKRHSAASKQVVRDDIEAGAMRQLGALGGQATLERFGPEHFAEIGRRGALARWAAKKDKEAMSNG